MKPIRPDTAMHERELPEHVRANRAYWDARTSGERELLFGPGRLGGALAGRARVEAPADLDRA